MLGLFLFLFFCAIIGGALILVFKFSKHGKKEQRELTRNWLLANGKLVKATLHQVRSRDVDATEPQYQIILKYVDENNFTHYFYSQWYDENPHIWLLNRVTFDVYINPNNPGQYCFSFPE